MGNFNDFAKSAGDSINLKEVGDETFTIVGVEESNYEDGTDSTPGVKISTKEEWTREDGKKVSKIHTTRRAIVSQLLQEDFVKALESGETFKVKCPADKVQSKKGGQPYYTLVAVE